MAARKTNRPKVPKRELREEDVLRELDGIELDARRRQRLETRATLQNTRTPLALIKVAETAVGVADDAIGKAMALDPAPARACKEGCDWCCYLQVGTTIPEVVRIIEYLRQTLSPQEFAATVERVRTTANQDQHLTPDERRRSTRPCPLLANRRCLAYPVRPLTCRGFNSEDAELCEGFLHDRSLRVPVYEPQMRLAAFVLDGMRAGLAEAGLKGDRVELTAALRIAFEQTGAIEDWLAGRPAFVPARLD